jgi:hypothetical protein
VAFFISHSVQSPPEAETVKSPTLEIQKVETGYLEDKEPEASVPEADAADLEVKSKFIIKGTMSRDFFLVFFMNQFPPCKFATCVNDTGGKFATGVVYTMGTIIKLLTT